MSLRTGGQVGATLTAIINPNNLKIEGFYCTDTMEKGRPVLLTQDIRDLISQGFVVNDHEALSDPEELVRLKDILDINFQLIGKPVVTVSKEKVGKVTDFAAESTTFYIQKLYVGQSLLKSISGGRLSIDRTNIVEITDRKIIIQDLLKPSKIPTAARATA
jgi:sporulation protein YlmC with PRC-barrel domain